MTGPCRPRWRVGRRRRASTRRIPTLTRLTLPDGYICYGYPYAYGPTIGIGIGFGGWYGGHYGGGHYGGYRGGYGGGHGGGHR